MANQTWTKTTNGNVLDTLGNIVGTGDGAGTITLTSAQVQVTNGNTLRIEEGVTVLMAITGGTERFLVTRNATGSGTLRIVGTEAEPVIISSSAGTPGPGDYSIAVELSNSVAASNPTLEADWCIFEFAVTGILGANTQPTTVTCRNCTFRRITGSHIQGSGPVTLGVGIWSFEECVHDFCATDGNASSPIIRVSNAATAQIDVDHASINMLKNDGSQDHEILHAIGVGTINITNSVMSGFNAHGTREVFVAQITGSGAIVGDWNWWDTEGLGLYSLGANDVNQDPDFFSETCSDTVNQDLRPNFDTGAMTADDVGGRIGALDAYNIPVPPDPEPPPAEPECVDEYDAFISPTCVPYVCNYDFFTGEYPEDWREELYDRKNVSSHQLVVCITLPNRGIDPDAIFQPGVPITIIDIGTDTVTVDIGPWVQSMRPIRAERDIQRKEYQGSDIDLVITDWFGRLDPKIVGSLFYNLRWKGLRVDIGSWICTTQRVLQHGRYFLEDIKRRDESTVLHLEDWFLKTLDQPLRANNAGYLTKRVKNDAAGFSPEALSVDSEIAVIEKVRIVFIDEGREDSRVFDYVGEVTGLQGRGDIDTPFTTADGGVTIPLTAWGSFSGIFTPGDELGFTLSNISTGDPVSVIYGYLTSFGTLVEGTDIVASEFFEAQDLMPTMAEVRLRHGSPVTLLEACRIAADHGFLTLSTNGAGHVVLGGFKPTLALNLTQIQNVAICSTNDMKSCETENLPVYNLIRSSYDPREDDGVTHSGLVGGSPNRWLNYPTEELGADFNRSAIFWQEEFPFDVKLPGFSAGQEAAVFAVLQLHWAYFEGTPTARETLNLTTKLHNLNRDLEDIVRIESEHPAREVWAQVTGYGKEPVTSKEVSLTAIDISDIVQPDFSCGYAFCDRGHFTDDCWVIW